MIGRASVFVLIGMLSLARAKPGSGVAVLTASEPDAEEGVAVFGLE